MRPELGPVLRRLACRRFRSLPITGIWGVVWFALKIAFLLFVFSWTKGTLPRYRYDQLMRLGWKVFLPVSLGWVVLTAAVLQFGGWVPKP